MMLDTHPILMLSSILMHAQPCNDDATMRILQELARKPEVDPWTLLDTCEVPLLSPTLAALQTQCSLSDKPAHRVASALTCLMVDRDNSSALLDHSLLGVDSSTSHLGGSNVSAAHCATGIPSGFGTFLPVLFFCLLAYSFRPSSGKLYAVKEGAFKVARMLAKVAFDMVFMVFMWFTIFLDKVVDLASVTLGSCTLDSRIVFSAAVQFEGQEPVVLVLGLPSNRLDFSFKMAGRLHIASIIKWTRHILSYIGLITTSPQINMNNMEAMLSSEKINQARVVIHALTMTPIDDYLFALVHDNLTDVLYCPVATNVARSVDPSAIALPEVSADEVLALSEVSSPTFLEEEPPKSTIRCALYEADDQVTDASVNLSDDSHQASHLPLVRSMATMDCAENINCMGTTTVDPWNIPLPEDGDSDLTALPVVSPPTVAYDSQDLEDMPLEGTLAAEDVLVHSVSEIETLAVMEYATLPPANEELSHLDTVTNCAIVDPLSDSEDTLRRTDPDTAAAKAPVDGDKAVEIGLDMERKPVVPLESHSELDLLDICLPGRDKSDSRIKKPPRPVRIRSILSVAVGSIKKQNTSLRKLPDPSETSLLSDTSTLVDVDGVMPNKMEDIKEKGFLHKFADKANAVGDKFKMKKTIPQEEGAPSSYNAVDAALPRITNGENMPSDPDTNGSSLSKTKGLLNKIADKANAVGDKFKKKALPEKKLSSSSSSDAMDVTLCGPADSGSVASDLDMEGSPVDIDPFQGRWSKKKRTAMKGNWRNARQAPRKEEHILSVATVEEERPNVAPRFGDSASQVHILRTPDSTPPNGPLYTSSTLHYGSESSWLSRFSGDRTLVDADGALPTPAKDAIKQSVLDKMTGAVKTVGGKLKKRMKINRPSQELGPIPVSISAEEKAPLPVSSEVTASDDTDAIQRCELTETECNAPVAADLVYAPCSRTAELHSGPSGSFGSVTTGNDKLPYATPPDRDTAVDLSSIHDDGKRKPSLAGPDSPSPEKEKRWQPVVLRLNISSTKQLPKLPAVSTTPKDDSAVQSKKMPSSSKKAAKRKLLDPYSITVDDSEGNQLGIDRDWRQKSGFWAGALTKS